MDENWVNQSSSHLPMPHRDLHGRFVPQILSTTLDDIVIFSKTYENHNQRLEALFQKLHQAGLKLYPSKCHFFQRKIKLLGHMISEAGVSVDKEWSTPQMVTLYWLHFFLKKIFKGFCQDCQAAP